MAISEKGLLEKLSKIIEINESYEKTIEDLKLQNERLKNSESKFMVEIGCNLIMGTNISSPSGDIDLEIKFRETIQVSSVDVSQILKNGKNRDLFIKDLLFFVDDQNYEFFGIKKKNDLSDENIERVVCMKDIDKIKEYFDHSTSRSMDSSVVHTIFYKIVILNGEGKLDGMSFDNRDFIEKYFKMQLGMAYKLYKRLTEVF